MSDGGKPFPSGRAKNKQSKGRDGGDNEEHHHHPKRSILVLVVHRRSNEAMGAKRLAKGANLGELRCGPARDALMLTDLVGHAWR
jgi:hypothetical protein